MARKAKTSSMKDSVALAIGTKQFPPNADGTPGKLFPKGVHIRSNSGVQIEFIWNGRRYTETIPGTPTVEIVEKAIAKRKAVLEDIEYNRFVYEHAFPASRHIKVQDEARRSANVSPPLTMRQLLNDFVELYRKDNPHAHNTLHTYEEVIRSRLLPVLSELTPEQITKSWLIDFRSKLRKIPLSNKRIGNILTPLRGAMATAVEKDIVKINPFLGLTPTTTKRRTKVTLDSNGLPAFDEPLPLSLDPKIDKAAKLADPLDEDERMAVLMHSAGQIRNLFLFAMWTGLRTGELIALRWCDVDFKNNRILVRISWSKSAFTTTKGRKARWVTLTEIARQALLAQWGITGHLGRWIFHNPRTDDRWQNSERIRQHWIATLKAGKVRYRKPYQCRHTYASMMVSAGESAHWVAAQMGHEDTTMIAQVYSRWLKLPDITPGAASARHYAEEWTRVATLVEHQNTVTAEMDMVESMPLNGDDEEDDAEF